MVRYFYCNLSRFSESIITSSVNGSLSSLIELFPQICSTCLLMVVHSLNYYDGLHDLNFDKTVVYQSDFDPPAIEDIASIQKKFMHAHKHANLTIFYSIVPPGGRKYLMSQLFVLVFQYLVTLTPFNFPSFIVKHMFVVKVYHFP